MMPIESRLRLHRQQEFFHSFRCKSYNNNKRKQWLIAAVCQTIKIILKVANHFKFYYIIIYENTLIKEKNLSQNSIFLLRKNTRTSLIVRKVGVVKGRYCIIISHHDIFIIRHDKHIAYKYERALLIWWIENTFFPNILKSSEMKVKTFLIFLRLNEFFKNQSQFEFWKG
jgi:hypothetical protein